MYGLYNFMILICYGCLLSILCVVLLCVVTLRVSALAGCDRLGIRAKAIENNDFLTRRSNTIAIKNITTES